MRVNGTGDAGYEQAAMSEDTLARARAGDGEAFRELTEPYRRELQMHCYRILGSVQDAEDLLQETMLAAWRGLDQFDGRASLRAWLHRIATNRCLNALRDSGRRPRTVSAQVALPTPSRWAEPVWLEPYPDLLLEHADCAPGPDARYEAKETIELAFITALQHLPPRQRAVLVLRDVLGYGTAEVADILNSSQPAVKAALQRARETLQAHLPAGNRDSAPTPDSPRERDLVGRFATAFESGDIDTVVKLLTDDAWVTMPPEPHQYQGRRAIAAFLHDRALLRGTPLRVVPTRANTQPAFGCYLPLPGTGIARAYGLLVLTLEGDRIAAITGFHDTSIFPHFGLPRTLRT